MTDLATLEAQLLEASKPGAFAQVDHDLLRQAAAAVARLRRVEAEIDAARETIREAHEIHDNNNAPRKYGAPYGGLVKLTEALAALAALDQPTETKANG